MLKERFLSIIAARANRYILKKIPSRLIPFKGKFPILQPYQEKKYFKAIQENKNLEDLSEEFRKIVEDGSRISLMVEGFKEYLSENKISEKNFLKLDPKEKTEHLTKWMNLSCLDFSNIKIKNGEF